MWYKILVIIALLCPCAFADLPPTQIYDEGVKQGVFFNLDCVGAGIACSQAGITGTLTVSGGGSGDPILVNTVAITDAAGVDFTSGSEVTVTLNAVPTPDTATLGLVSGITRDTEWDTEAEMQTAWGAVNIILATELVDANMQNDALDPDKLVGDAVDDDKVNSSIVQQNAGTDINADLEEETHATEHADAGTDEIAITAGMMNAGTGASATTFWRGDNTWATPSGADTNAVKEYWWPAPAMLPLETADSIPPIAKDAGTNIDMLIRDFDDTTDECVTCQFKVPSDVTSGSTITFRAHWYSAAATSGNVILDFRHNSGVAEGTDPDVALTTEASAADATQGTAGQITVTTWTETLTNLGWAANEDVMAEMCRDANNGSDTLVGDLRLIGFAVEIPRS